MKRSRGDRLVLIVNSAALGLLTLIFLYPLYFTVLASVSEPRAVALGEVFLWPRGFSLEAYQNAFQNQEIWRGYRNSIAYTLCATLWSLTLTIPAAYVMSKKWLPLRAVISWFFLFTMYFGGGLIPTYILIKSIGLIDHPLVMILPGGLSVYNMIVTRVYYQSTIPEELYESAKIDGASEALMFVKIALPLSAPIVAVMALYYGAGNWNAWFSAMIYLSNSNYYPLQLVLRNILLMNQNALSTLITEETMDPTVAADAAQWLLRKTQMAESMKYALIFISSAPMLAAYPFVQKYFVRGVMIGSLKG